MRVAAIDLGSNSCVFLVVDGETGEAVESDLEFTRLGEGLEASGLLSQAAIARSLLALERFARRARDLDCRQIACVGTAALRTGLNRADLVEAAADFGLSVQAISGAEEAELSASAALDGKTNLTEALVIDVGGASTEFVRIHSGTGLIWRRSLDLGSVRLDERFHPGAPADLQRFAEIRGVIREALKTLPPVSGLPVVAVAGTAVTLGQAVLGLSAYDSLAIDCHTVTRAEIASLVEQLLGLTVEERILRYGLPRGRADVIPVGLVLLEESLNAVSRQELLIRDRGVAWGLAQRLIAKH